MNSRSGPIGVDDNVRRVVRILMAARDVDAQALAGGLGVHRQSLYDRLGGKARFSVEDVARMAVIFDVDPGLFFDLEFPT